MVRALVVALVPLIATACAADRAAPSFPRSAPARHDLVAVTPSSRSPATYRVAPLASSVGRVTYVAPAPRPAAVAPLPSASTSSRVGIEGLRERADAVGRECDGVTDVRRCIERLASALEVSSGSPADRKRIDEDVAAYKESCAMSKLPVASAVLACAGLASCSSTDGKIAKLRGEEAELTTRIDALQNERKSIERLVTALQEYQRSGNSVNAEKLEKAREQYEVAKR